jgi:transcriptional regulator with XRE-family HTH domain
MLGWSAAELAEKSGVTRNTIQRLESYEEVPPSRTQSMVEIMRSLTEAGVVFVEADDQYGPGVRLAKPA